MRIEHVHDLPKTDARTRLELLGEVLVRKYGCTVRWEGDTAHVTGRVLVQTFHASATLEPGRLILEGDDPGLLWRDKVRAFLGKHLGRWLDPRTPLDALPRP